MDTNTVIQQPVISIVITCFNDGDFMPVCISSVQKIKGIPYELIIVDDGSTDAKTIKLLQELKSSGLTVISQPNQGSSFARNTGIGHAKAPYILLIDGDDFIEPELVYEGVKALDEQPGAGVVYTDVKTFGNENSKRHLPDFDFPKLLTGNFVYISSVFRRVIWEQNSGFDTNPGLTAHQDWDFWIQAAKTGWKFHHIKKYLFHYRIRANSVSSAAHQPEAQKEINKYLVQKHAEAYKEHAGKIILSLKETNFELVGTIKMLDVNCRAYSEKIAGLESHISNMERSFWWKIKLFFNKVRRVFSSKTEESFSKRGFIKKVFFFITSKGFQMFKAVLKKIFKKVYLLLEDKSVSIISDKKTENNKFGSEYQKWIRKHELGQTKMAIMKSRIAEFYEKPVMSILVQVSNPGLPAFTRMMESVISQIYPFWELCLTDDVVTDPKVKELIRQFGEKEPRIKILHRQDNQRVVDSYNHALELATGDFILLLGHEDELEPQSLFEVANVISENPQADLIYSDEDTIDHDNVRFNPAFKPDWSPDKFLAGNYISRMAVMRRSIITKISGFRPDYEEVQEYDLLLRFTEETKNIFHIPDVLYHSRVKPETPVSADFNTSLASRTAQRSLAESLARRGELAVVDFVPGHNGNFNVRYAIKEHKKVSVIIPTKNKADVLETCLKSLFEKTIYPDFEVILIDNRSDHPSLFHLVQFFEKTEPERFRCIRLDIDFNFSKIMNEAVKHCTGEYILLLNNDTEVLVADWMDAMVEQAQRKSIGAVGAKLLYHNDTVQHGGVIIGICGVADHAFAGAHRDGPSYMNYVNLVNNFSAVTAACLMVRKEVYLEVGGFDEGFAVEFNDVDFCLKLISAGYYNIFLPYVILYHYESLTRGHPKASKESLERHLVEVQRFKGRWKKYIDHDPFYNPNFSLSNANYKIKID